MIPTPRFLKRGLVGAPITGLILSLALLSFRPMASSGRQPATGSSLELAPYVETLPGSVVMIGMRPVPGGVVKIGAKEVAVKPFWMAETETPWEAFDTFTASGPASKPYDQTKFGPDAIARPSHSYILPDLGWGHHGYPAINISIDSAVMYCRWLASVTKKKYRLPTQAEWEFACRQGSPGNATTDLDLVDQASWNNSNSGHKAHPVGKKIPDKLGLYDMLGNVGEWATDPDGQPVLCGATYLDDPVDVSPSLTRRWSPKWQETDPQIPKSRWWLSDGPFVGFRVVCEP